jgi:hypothetical protein
MLVYELKSVSGLLIVIDLFVVQYTGELALSYKDFA